MSIEWYDTDGLLSAAGLRALSTEVYDEDWKRVSLISLVKRGWSGATRLLCTAEMEYFLHPRLQLFPHCSALALAAQSTTSKFWHPCLDGKFCHASLQPGAAIALPSAAFSRPPLSR